MPKPPRYYIDREGGGAWVVCDRRKQKLHGDVVERHKTRGIARGRARKLNFEDAQERNADTQTGARETI